MKNSIKTALEIAHTSFYSIYSDIQPSEFINNRINDAIYAFLENIPQYLIEESETNGIKLESVELAHPNLILTILKNELEK